MQSKKRFITKQKKLNLIAFLKVLYENLTVL